MSGAPSKRLRSKSPAEGGSHPTPDRRKRICDDSREGLFTTKVAQVIASPVLPSRSPRKQHVTRSGQPPPRYSLRLSGSVHDGDRDAGALPEKRTRDVERDIEMGDNDDEDRHPQLDQRNSESLPGNYLYPNQPANNRRVPYPDLDTTRSSRPMCDIGGIQRPFATEGVPTTLPANSPLAPGPGVELDHSSTSTNLSGSKRTVSSQPSDSIDSLAISSRSSVFSDRSMDDLPTGSAPHYPRAGYTALLFPANSAPPAVPSPQGIIRSSSFDNSATGSKISVLPDSSMDGEGDQMETHITHNPVEGGARTLAPTMAFEQLRLGQARSVQDSLSSDSLAASSRTDILSDASMYAEGGRIETHITYNPVEGEAPALAPAVALNQSRLGQAQSAQDSPSSNSLAASSRTDILTDASMNAEGGRVETHITHNPVGEAPAVAFSQVRPGQAHLLQESISSDSLAATSKSDILSDTSMGSRASRNLLDTHFSDNPVEGEASAFSAAPAPAHSTAAFNQFRLGHAQCVQDSISSNSLVASSRTDILSDAPMYTEGGRVETHITHNPEGGEAHALAPTVAFNQIRPGQAHLLQESISSDSLATTTKSDILSDALMGSQASRNLLDTHFSDNLVGEASAFSATPAPAHSTVAFNQFRLGHAQCVQDSISSNSLAASSRTDILSDVSMNAEGGRVETHITHNLVGGEAHALAPTVAFSQARPGQAYLLQESISSDSLATTSKSDALSNASMGEPTYDHSIQLPMALNLKSVVIPPAASTLGPLEPRFQAAPFLIQSDSIHSLAMSSHSDVISDSSVVPGTIPSPHPAAPSGSLATASKSDVLSDARTDAMAVVNDLHRVRGSLGEQHYLNGVTGAPIDPPSVLPVHPTRDRDTSSRNQPSRQNYVQHWVATLSMPSEPERQTLRSVGSAFSQNPLSDAPIQKILDPPSVIITDGSVDIISDSDTFSSGRDDAQSQVRRSMWRHPTVFSPNSRSVSIALTPGGSSIVSRSAFTANVPGNNTHSECKTSICASSARTAIYSDEGGSSHFSGLAYSMDVDQGDTRPVVNTPGVFRQEHGASRIPMSTPLMNNQARPPRFLPRDFQDDIISLKGTDSVVTMDVDATTDEDEDGSIHLSPLSQCLILSDHPESDEDVDISGARVEEPPFLPLVSSSSNPPAPGSRASSNNQVPRFRRIYQDLLQRREEVIRCGDMANILQAVARRTGSRHRRSFASSGSRTISASSLSSLRIRHHSSAGGHLPRGLQKRNVRRPRNPTRVAVARDVRTHALEMLGREKNTSPITSVVQSRIDRWVMSDKQQRYGPNSDNFQVFLDFKHVSNDMRPHCNDWNNQSKEVFADDFVAKYPEFRSHREMVINCFAVHLKQLRNQFNKLNSATDESTRALAVKARKEQMRRSRCSRRLSTMKIFFKGKGRAMERIVKVAEETLDWRCCSGDETDEDGDHAITHLPWRSDELTELFRYVDLLGLCLRFPDGVHATSGRFPLHRYDPKDKDPPSESKEDPYRSSPVSGLPENFYDPAWRHRIGDKKRAVHLKLPDDMIRLAETALPVRSRHSQPFQRNYDL